MTPSNRLNRERGFTLIELLLVTVILGVIGMVLYATLAQGLKLWKRAQSGTPELRALLLSEKMASDLRNVYPCPDKGFSGSRDSAKFCAVLEAVGVNANKEAVLQTVPMRVHYYRERGGYSLLREHSETSLVAGAQDGSWPVAEKLDEFELTYYGRNTSGVLNWQRSWEKEYAPDAVKLVVSFKDFPKKKMIQIIQMPGGGDKRLEEVRGV